MIHMQAIKQQEQIREIGNVTSTEALISTKTIKVNVLNQQGQNQDSYSISGLGFQKLGDNLKNQAQVIQVLINGVPMSLNQAKNITFADAGSTITIMDNANMGINASYTMNGQVIAIGNTNGDYVTQNSAKIYVPNNLLENKENQLTSVAINGIQYTATIDGNYVIVNGNIPAISAASDNIVVNFQNKNIHNQSDSLTKGTATIQAIIMNEYGQQISSQTIENGNGYSLLPILSGLTAPAQSMTYNGSNVTVMNLLTQDYTPGTNNLFVITVNSPSPINLSVGTNGSNFGNVSLDGSSITASNATLKLPAALLRHWTPKYITINGVEYKGKLIGDNYIVNAFIPEAIQYQTNVFVNHKQNS